MFSPMCLYLNDSNDQSSGKRCSCSDSEGPTWTRITRQTGTLCHDKTTTTCTVKNEADKNENEETGRKVPAVVGCDFIRPVLCSRFLRPTFSSSGVAHQIPSKTTQVQGQGRVCERNWYGILREVQSMAQRTCT